MFLKATLLGCALVSTPICIATLPQDAPRGQGGQHEDSAVAPAVAPRSQADADEIEALRAQIKELQAKVDQMDAAEREASARAIDAQAEVALLKARLDECLELLEKSTVKLRNNCTPSRTRKLLTHYQWMNKSGYDDRANRLIHQVVETHGSRNDQLNSLAWHLMTSKETSGQFESAALALAERMEKNGHLRHQFMDTVALAKFLNGQVTEAIAMQKLAIRKGGSSDEYRRRLRVYEAAARRTAPGIAAAGGSK